VTLKLKIKEIFQRFIDERRFRTSITRNRQKGWKKITFLTVRSIMVIYKGSLCEQRWERNVCRKDLKTIARLSSVGKYSEIIIDDGDFLEW